MSGHWIKIEHVLPSKPEVIQLADRLGISEEAVIGHLVRFWSWVDQNLSLECPATIGTRRGLDRVAQRDGFADAMIAVGWLDMDGDTIRIPNYEAHLSQSAKQRALESKKKMRQRQMSRKCPDTNGTTSGHDGDDQRDQSKSKSKSIQNTSYSVKGERAAFAKPTFEEVQSYAPDIDAEHFWHHHESRGWVLSNGKKMKDWKSAVVTWRKNQEKFTKPKAESNGKPPLTREETIAESDRIYEERKKLYAADDA